MKIFGIGVLITLSLFGFVVFSNWVLDKIQEIDKIKIR